MTQEPQTYKEPSVCADKMATNCMGAGQGSVVCSRGEGAGLGGGRLGLDLLDHVGRQRRLARRPVTQRALPLVDRGKRRLHTSRKRTQLANPALEVNFSRCRALIYRSSHEMTSESRWSPASRWPAGLLNAKKNPGCQFKAKKRECLVCLCFLNAAPRLYTGTGLDPTRLRALYGCYGSLT